MASSFPNFVRILRRALLSRGIELDPLLHEGGLGAYARATERLPIDITSRIWAVAERVSQDPTLGLTLIKHVDLTDFEELGVVIVSVTSPEQTLDRMARYNRLVSDALTLTRFDRPANGSTVALSKGTMGVMFEPIAGAHWRTLEFAAAIFARLLRTRFGDRVGPVSVSFAFDNPKGLVTYERFFGCPVTLKASRSSIEFHAGVVDTQEGSGPTIDLFSRFEPMLDARLSEIAAASTPWVDRVAAFLGNRLKDGEPSLDEVAKALAVSSRTLQRHLSSEGKSFQDVLDDTRRKLATQWLARADMTLTQVAFLLGFSSSSAFSRAHKRWFGEAPSQAKPSKTKA